MLARGGLVLSLIAVLLQIAVFLQPLLPARYQLAVACDTIIQALSAFNQDHHIQSAALDHTNSHTHDHTNHEQHALHTTFDNAAHHNHHAIDHECLYCKVYGHVLPMLHINLDLVTDRIQLRLGLWQQRFRQHYFNLQRLYLTPQGRAPPFLSLF